VLDCRFFNSDLQFGEGVQPCRKGDAMKGGQLADLIGLSDWCLHGKLDFATLGVFPERWDVRGWERGESV